MSQPTVCAVMLTANRPEMARRAVECFRAQTYDSKCLLIWDTSHGQHFARSLDLPLNERCVEGARGYSIGELRNQAAAWVLQVANPVPDIICTFDDDDWSHPNRIAEQVALLQSSGAQAVGYREMLFWREPRCKECGDYANTNCDENGSEPLPGEAWLYRNGNPSYCVGTSLCYWRKTWEAKPFPALPRPGDVRGEDTAWLQGLKSVGVSGLNSGNPAVAFGHGGPAMIARIHAGNTSPNYQPELMRIAEKQGGEWRRVPEWDAVCRAAME